MQDNIKNKKHQKNIPLNMTPTSQQTLLWKEDQNLKTS